MVKFQVMGAVMTRNMILKKGQTVSSIELFTGVKPSIARDVRAECGEYCHVYVSPSEIKKRGMAARTVAAIALISAGNGRGTWWFLSLATGAVFRGDRWVSMPMTDLVIETMNKMSDADHTGVTKRKVAKKTREKKVVRFLQPILEEEEQEEDIRDLIQLPEARDTVMQELRPPTADLDRDDDITVQVDAVDVAEPGDLTADVDEPVEVDASTDDDTGGAEDNTPPHGDRDIRGQLVRMLFVSVEVKHL
jgi:hypothetical protein